MKNSLGTPRSSSPAADPSSSMALAVAKNMLTRDYPSQPEYLLEPLGASVRASLERRKDALEYWLQPAAKGDYPVLTKAIAEMMGAFAANSSGSPQATVAKYLHVVHDLPPWAISKACSMIETGQAEGVSLDFRPSAPRLRDVARGVMAPWLEELALVRAALAAEEPAPEDVGMRKRVGELLSGLARGLRTKTEERA